MLAGAASGWRLIGPLARTDAALGAGMMVNPAVPARIRRLINVESGLNDGIATPFVSVALAGAATGGQVADAIHPHEGEESPACRRQDQSSSHGQRREGHTEVTEEGEHHG